MFEPKSKNLLSVVHGVSRAERELQNRHRAGVLWFTGLPASGKSTLAMRLEQRLYSEGIQAYVLDGDNIRQSLSVDLSFSQADRSENLRRVAEVAKLMVDAGLVCITAFISPLCRDRDQARAINGADFHEIYTRRASPLVNRATPRVCTRKRAPGF